MNNSTGFFRQNKSKIRRFSMSKLIIESDIYFAEETSFSCWKNKKTDMSMNVKKRVRPISAHQCQADLSFPCEIYFLHDRIVDGQTHQCQFNDLKMKNSKINDKSSRKSIWNDQRIKHSSFSTWTNESEWGETQSHVDNRIDSFSLTLIIKMWKCHVSSTITTMEENCLIIRLTRWW